MGAVISSCGQYRYRLTRKTRCPLRWVRKCLFIMLNPSTADAEKDDPTIRRCIWFAEQNGCPDLTVVNLYALRSTDPMELMKHPDPVGPENKKYLFSAIESHDVLIAAWGQHPAARMSDLASELLTVEDLMCLGVTKHGYPKHPLYIRKDQPLVKFSGSR